ncbi:MAG TPA: helix-turn-helix domain-containing protein [Gemmatimonadaceae bacterium]|nr:helix-turn-helix domain-containing protein [Gemmatimonadaceae bacterium]
MSVDWCRGSISTGTASTTLLRTELRLFGALVATEGKPVHSHVLIRSTWPDATGEVTTRHALRAYMQSLRHRLKRLGVHGKLRRVRGIGYSFGP